MFLSQSGFSRLFAASCAFSGAALLLAGGSAAYAQAADTAQTANAIDNLYVSSQGSDAWTGQSPVPSGDSGPCQTLAHAQEALNALAAPSLARPVEITVDPAVCSAQNFLGRWFSAAPNTPVIWHADSARTILIYTPVMSQQIDALAAEDFAHAAEAPITRFYVAPSGSDAWRGAAPAEDADNGPFRTLDRAQEAVAAFLAERPGAPVEVVFEAGQFMEAAVKPNKAPNMTAKIKALAAMKASAVAATKSAIAASHVATGSAPAIVFGKGGPVVIKGGPIAKSAPKLVFAHYMVCNRDYGGSVAGYERDIQEAQAAGINGFALNCGAWNGANYKGDTGSLFQAAQAVAPDGSFKLFFSADMTGLSYAEVVQMMTAYASHPNYWRIAQTTATGTVNRPVLSTWGGEGGTWDGPTTASVKARWQNLVLTPLKAAGINTYFMPFFFMSSANGQGADTNSGTISAEVSGLLSGLADGFFYLPSIGCPVDKTQNVFATAETFSATLKAAGLGSMSSVTPQYWGSRQTYLGRRYLEYDGGEGLTAQWTSIINVQKPDWVECFTWNDFDEATYFSPIDDVNKYWPYAAHPALGFYKSHAGALKLNQYFINWYKTGVKPAVTNDSMYCFYRTHPKAAVATNDYVGPINWFIGDCQDDIYITTILTAPASLVVTTGSQTVTLPVAAGLVNTRVPFQVGAQSFQIVRGGQTVVSQIGTPIVAAPAEYNFSYYTVAASSN